MTSGVFRSTPLSSIIVDRAERQRRELTGIDELAESLNRTGLINPIVITQDNVLVAGERRLTAAKALGWTAITTQYVEDLSEYELQIIELEENIKRSQLPWQDECLALERIHALHKEHDPTWTQAKTASSNGMDSSDVARKLMVAQALKEGNERVMKADKFSVARNLVERDIARKKSSTVAAVQLFTPTEAEEPAVPRPPLLHADFTEWQRDYDGPKFNLIHCDFPYGINVANSPRQSASIGEFYADTPDVYWALLDTLERSMENVIAESAHLIFWFSMHFYQATLERLEKMGWTVSPFPLVWHKSNNSGVAPDPQRQPRRTYETAFFGIRGDRKLTSAGATANSFSHPGGTEIHLSEKPVPMLTHFMRSLCDEYSTVLDPTCGSGNALKAATVLGAHTVLGIEKLEDFYITSCNHYWEKPDVQL